MKTTVFRELESNFGADIKRDLWCGEITGVTSEGKRMVILELQQPDDGPCRLAIYSASGAEEWVAEPKEFLDRLTRLYERMCG